ncbi:MULTISPECIES: RidA family protein [unclassified Shinella]|uniref:RidA family protein n=1 Tax=unclassified Shinella TaxID=2643062 RepID=UPI00225CCC05|nr:MULTISPECIES: RidA family protein [unclassified Shinella]MCO5137932.1 RidA family protein [Shinella sp.]MDC7258049.1 RidA family protein [Shinella sp. YE25]CAI0335198.1 putative 2-iminobutanoate/2-iminopropanoate deaminase [Rhizobiaceae bacterium]CAK7259508.1 2-iminobutanoate/2-iminopropanoate deaminase [Shinella sp. WSC3-e]
MAENDAPFFIEDTDETEISSDTAGLGDLLVTTHIPLRADGSLETGDITTQSVATLESLKASLEKAGSSLADVVHLTIYLTDITERPAFNEVYCAYFKKPYPVRCAVGVAALADPGMRVEVTAMAARRGRA